MGYNCYASYCDSGCSNDEGRNFLTKAEKIEMLQTYKKRLDKESQGVAEKIAEMQEE